jgi:solute carrier family 25 citrate transporter 1
MQLSTRARRPGAKKRGFIKTGMEVARKETPLALYKGLGAVTTGIVPKMAIRFTSFEAYKKMLADKETGSVTGKATFLGMVPLSGLNGVAKKNSQIEGVMLGIVLIQISAGLAAGVTEAVAVVTPMEVVKIRLQGQYHSMADPLDIPKYRNAAHALFTVLREEGVGALWRGVSLTALRQGSNQAVNFTAYTEFKEILQKWQPEYETSPLPSYQTTLIGLVSGAMGPLSNAPIDTIKTRLQKFPSGVGESTMSRIRTISREMFK